MKGHTSHVKGHRIVRSVCGMLLAFSMMFFHTGYTAYADDDDVEIKKVTINIKSDITKEDSDAIVQERDSPTMALRRSFQMEIAGMLRNIRELS